METSDKNTPEVSFDPGGCWRAIKHDADKLEASENAGMEGFSGLPCTCHALAHLCSCD